MIFMGLAVHGDWDIWGFKKIRGVPKETDEILFR